ncbi:allophanate hydrolase [Vibrio methylphosphonaticus]|uniref:allophanate hydrolase n=1 Tax=Vibrio methylphosphonaticus TaxID=2946866 RepID=UPI002029D443|nr:allophanate hydrolase [Vibrio methylphosphonaticus]MCL9773565.1 allophanate hydrolase [Vibrio methylphosphonaticus]
MTDLKTPCSETSLEQAALLTIDGLLGAYRSGKIHVAEFLRTKLNAVRADNSNAWISVISDQQLEAYLSHLATQDRESLPLYGVPFAIKDNIDLEGLDTTAGCEAYRYQPSESAYVVQQLISAGAVPLGKTSLDQFATGLVGTRSPWGAVSNSFNSDYISGGSSSGSAVSVASNQVYFALGTDTAGSGRVPAAFNNLYGLKPTKGLLSCSGVVPACRTLDCVTFFAKSAQDLTTLYQVGASYDGTDCFAREAVEKGREECTQFSGLRVGIPADDQLEFFGNQEYRTLYAQAVSRIESLGGKVIPFDLAPFIQAANLLYQGPWVAERYAGIDAFFDGNKEQCLEVIQTIVGGAKNLSAADTFKAIYQLQAFKVQCDQLMDSVDVVLTPTAGTIYTKDDVNSDPIALNSNLGYYTNFMNLLDYSAIAMPSGFTGSGLPFGVTLFAQAFQDEALISLASEWQTVMGLPLGATQVELESAECMDLLVCGAHMNGLPLNHQLIELGANFKRRTTTADRYSLYCLAGGPPLRPGLVRNQVQGERIDVEVWRIPKKHLGALLEQIPHPLGLGSVELASGKWVKGFICEGIGIEEATDITETGGWRHFLTQS